MLVVALILWEVKNPHETTVETPLLLADAAESTDSGFILAACGGQLAMPFLAIMNQFWHFPAVGFFVGLRFRRFKSGIHESG